MSTPLERVAGVARRLEEWQLKLLDLSRRNRLVHFRAPRVSSVRVVDELPPEVFRLAVQKRAKMSIAPRAADGPVRAADERDVYRPYRAEDISAHHVDRVLQSDLEQDDLERNLLAVYRKASSVEEEHGYNTLYLALGFLEWYETSTSDEAVWSPLVLVPVELTRRRAGAGFSLRVRDEEPVLNPALVRRLEEFGIELPSVPEDLDDMDARLYFNALASAAETVDRWRVTNAIHLALFSFTKFTMYKDLEAQASRFAEHPLVGALAGESDAVTRLADVEAPTGEQLDVKHPRHLYSVMDADSSQREAIEAAKAGCNLVIEGPPGTGKSQTIANLIAECLCAGKSVLFVSEKMAALDVVYRRLVSCGLGDFCLELHSHKTSRRRVIEELRRVLELPRSSSRVKEEALEHLAETRDSLNAYVSALRDPFGPLGVSPYYAFGRLAALADVSELPVFIAEAADWDRDRYEANLGKLRQFVRTAERVGEIDGHPWRGVQIRDVTYELELTLRERLDTMLAAHAELERLSGDLASSLNAESPATLDEVDQLLDLAELVANPPQISRTTLERTALADDGVAFVEELDDLQRYGRKYATSRMQLEQRYRSVVFEADVEPVLRWWRERGKSAFRYLMPAFYRHRSKLRRWLLPSARADVVRDLESVLTVQRVGRELDEWDGSRVADHWNGSATNWRHVGELADWLGRYAGHVESGLATQTAHAYVVDSGNVSWSGSGLIERVQSARQLYASAWSALVEVLGVGEEHGRELDAMRARVERMRGAMDSLEDWVRYSTARDDVSSGDTAAFFETVEQQGGDSSRASIEAVFERQFFRSWIEAVLAERSELRTFDGQVHAELIESFCEADAQMAELNRLRVRTALLERYPDVEWDAARGSDLGLLQREVRKKRGHVSLRKLLASIPESLRRLKPCMMMSPLSVAQFLDPEAEPFDLVVFDEASQIAPEDAIGAIARGRQLVVVGDSKQLPPTSFFHSERFESGDEDFGEGDLESILDECATVFPHRRMLRWHYRSRHESLIAFSNSVYYGGQLYSFPSPDAPSPQRGVRFVHVPEGVYDRGGSGKNAIEAKAIAEAVFAHLRDHPDKSVGIGAFSVAQQEAIADALEELRREDSSLESRFHRDAPDYCFVKNLETIQGDERDVIFLSIGYARDADGKMSLNFGPLNQQSGPRRMNVLVTRARESVIVYASITADDIDLSRTSADGVRQLHRYLDYAQRGAVALETSSNMEAHELGDLERAVTTQLVERGYNVDRLVGYSGYRIDLAVRDVDRYVLGIECDGPAYQRAATAAGSRSHPAAGARVERLAAAPNLVDGLVSQAEGDARRST